MGTGSALPPLLPPLLAQPWHQEGGVTSGKCAGMWDAATGEYPKGLSAEAAVAAAEAAAAAAAISLRAHSCDCNCSLRCCSQNSPASGSALHETPEDSK